VLHTVVGSQVHGLVRGNTDDRDEMVIYIEPPEAVLAGPRIQHWSYRTQPEGQPSGPGDLDLIAYGLGRYCELALKGSPTVLLPLFAPPEHTLVCTDIGGELRGMAEEFAAGGAHRSFLGYLHSQRGSLLQGRPRRRELSDAHGYDTKYAMHALRVGYQGIEFMRDRVITLPMPEPQRSRLMDVRMGKVPLSSVLAEMDDLIAELEATPGLIIDPPVELSVRSWVISKYLEAWKDWEPLPLL
jgi:hypothetical protein